MGNILYSRLAAAYTPKERSQERVLLHTLKSPPIGIFGLIPPYGILCAKVVVSIDETFPD